MAGYIGSAASVVSSGAENKKTFTITGSTTSLTGLKYPVGKVHVFQNGVRLVDGTDYTATNGTTITLTVAAQSGDNVVVISQASYQVALSGIDDQSNATAITIDSSGNVGIGTSSPNNYSANHKSITLNAPTTPLIDLEVNGTRTGSFVADSTKIDLNAVTSVPIRFLTADTERMRIDASGNLLVGNTVANPASGFSNQAGFGYTASTGVVEVATTANAAPMEIGKNNSNDGQLIALRKQGTTVGSIATQGSRLSIGSGDVNLNFNASANSMYPISDPAAGTLSSGIVDLGAALATFKDAYIGGGVYLGGTGSANKLDDYETGNWTPSLSGQVSATYSNQTGMYTKIGNLVIAKYFITVSAYSGHGSNLNINQLPFTINSSYAQYGGGVALADNLTNAHSNIYTQPSIGSTSAVYIGGNGTTGSHFGIPSNHFTVNTAHRGTIIYMTS
ncbi:hypothetical protein N9I05_01650 [Pseudomonadales bacterium]|nr:hypothetical protein [Pseudomonadales bacterium]